MNESVMIGLAATGCVLGFFLNRTYVKKYGEAAIQWPALILQCICVAGALSQLPGGVVSFWFVFWPACCRGFLCGRLVVMQAACANATGRTG